MAPVYFCRWIGRMIMKFLPECNFVNLSECPKTPSICTLILNSCDLTSLRELAKFPNLEYLSCVDNQSILLATFPTSLHWVMEINLMGCGITDFSPLRANRTMIIKLSVKNHPSAEQQSLIIHQAQSSKTPILNLKFEFAEDY